MADTKEILKCPACGREMKKIYISGADLNIDICVDGCGGMLFDNRELEKFDENSENADAILNEVKGKEFIAVDETKHRICPVCNSIMVKNRASGGVKIDVCNVCGAKFLDHGELEKIRESSGKKYEETPQNRAMYEMLEKDVSKETIGAFGSFINEHLSASGGRKAVEDFIRKFV